MLIRVCDYCGKEIKSKNTRYMLRVDICAAYDELKIDEHDIDQDCIAEINKIIGQLEKMDPQEVTAEVHEAIEMDLCRECRGIFHRYLLNDKRKLLRLLLEPSIYGRN
jgi:Zn-finger nucleic acid-binding protein